MNNGITHEDALAMVGPGWSGLLHQLYDKIEEDNLDVKVEDIKEKYGGLRIYYWVEYNPDHNDALYNKFYEFVEELMKKSYKICEECGNLVESIRSVSGWYKSWCNRCYDEYKSGEQ